MLHISGIRPLPDPNHGKILFKALVVEIVVISMSAFSAVIIPKKLEPMGEGMIGPATTSKGIFLEQSRINNSATLESAPLLPEADVRKDNGVAATGENCHQITSIDQSKYPATSKIETICEDQ